MYVYCMYPVSQWLQLDVGPATLITGLVTRGRGDARRRHWVSKLRLSYSNDSRTWHFYKRAPHLSIHVRLVESVETAFTHPSTNRARRATTTRARGTSTSARRLVLRWGANPSLPFFPAPRLTSKSPP